MKKFIFGLVIGIMLATTSAAYADEIKSLIGNQIDGSFPLYLNDKRLATDVAVVEGTSYVPVRALVEALGLNIEFKDETVRITATPGNEVDRMTNSIPKVEVEEMEINQTVQSQIDSLDRQIEWQKHRLYLANEDLKFAKPEAAPIITKGIKEIEIKIADLEKQKEALTKTP